MVHLHAPTKEDPNFNLVIPRTLKATSAPLPISCIKFFFGTITSLKNN